MMKKVLIIFVAIAVLAPLTTYAFSFTDVFSFSRRFLIHKEPQLSPSEKKTEMAAAVKEFSSDTAAQKYQNWLNAFNKKDITLVINDSQNLYFTEAEVNYLIAQTLANATDPAARDINVSFMDNLAKVSGYSMVKNFSGDFSLEIKPVQVNGKIVFQVTKARYHNFYFPAFLAQELLNGQMKDALNFLNSAPNGQKASLAVGSGFIELKYDK